MPAPGALIGFVPITDGERAKSFYADVLGLHFVSDDGFALVFRSEANEGANMVRLVRMPAMQPQAFTILGWESTRIAADIVALTARGVVFQRFPSMEQDEAGIWTAPDGDKVAWFRDPDGNMLSLSQHGKAK